MDETDVFFNLRLGELVLGTGKVTTENLLSFTHPQTTDINLAWLFQVVLALVHRVAGLPGTVLLKTAFVLGTWTVLFRVAIRRGANLSLAALALALAAWAAEPRFVERPHLVTFLGLALLLLSMERAEHGYPRMLWWMVPGGLVWANSNSCFFLAPTVLLLYALGAWRDGLRVEARRALWVALTMIPFMFATPAGFHCLSYIANHFRMPYLRPLQEYRHAQWPLDGPFFFLVAGLLLARLLSLVVPRLRNPLPDRVFLPCMMLAILGGLRIRFVAEFAMLAGPALAVAATRLLPFLHTRVLRWATVFLLVGLIVTPRVLAMAEGRRAFDIGLESDLVPFTSIDFVEKHDLRERMYNDLEVGSYLTWHGWPKFRVFQDPRINAYPDSFHAVLRRSDLSRTEWQSLLESYGVTSALITFPSLNPRGALFDPALWALVYRANDGLVFVRRPVRQDLVELPLTFTYSPTSGLEPVPLLALPEGVQISSCEWQRRLGDYYRAANDVQSASCRYEAAMAEDRESSCGRESRIAAGLVALQLGDPVKAARLLDGATSSVARTNRGFALLGMDQAEQALAQFEQVLAVEQGDDDASFGRGMSLVKLGRSKEAIATFENLLARSPNHMSAFMAKQQLQRLREGVGKR
jgi:hypothetical protein